MIKVLLVDDHHLIRLALKNMLDHVQGIKVVADVASGEEAIALCKKEKVDVVVMDLQMPGIGGLEAVRKILRFDPMLRILVLTVYDDEPYPSRLMHMGVAGYITKNCDLKEMVQAIKAVHAGNHYIGYGIAQQVALSKCSFSGPKTTLDALSKRETQMMLMIINGKSVQEISDELFLSYKTVNTYRHRIFKKLGIRSDVELTLLGMRLGLLNKVNS